MVRWLTRLECTFLNARVSSKTTLMFYAIFSLLVVAKLVQLPLPSIAPGIFYNLFFKIPAVQSNCHPALWVMVVRNLVDLYILDYSGEVCTDSVLGSFVEITCTSVLPHSEPALYLKAPLEAWELIKLSACLGMFSFLPSAIERACIKSQLLWSRRVT